MATITGFDDKNDVLDGTILGDFIDGKDGADRLDGRAGADTLTGGLGNDIVKGGFGDDSLIVGAGHDDGIETYDGGSGEDELVISTVLSPAGSSVAFDFSGDFLTSLEELRFSGAATSSARFSNTQLGNGKLSSDLLVTGSSGSDTVQVNVTGGGNIDVSGWTFSGWGTTDSLFLIGDTGGNTIIGSSRKDSINAGLGVDNVSAGGGDDTVNITGSSTGERYDGGSGEDTLLANGTTSLVAAEVAGFEKIAMAGAQTIQVSALASQFGGGKLSSSLSVSFGNDGAVDFFSVILGNETFFNASAFTALDADSSDTFEFVGGAGDNIIQGSAFRDLLRGSGGTDQLIGGTGNDILDGGLGDDIMLGGAGNDRNSVNSAGDIAVEVISGSDPGGTDIVISTVSHSLSGFIENLSLAGNEDLDGTGNRLDNAISGNSGVNALNGGAGDDKITGGDGGDGLNGGLGADSFVYEELSHSLAGSDTRDTIRAFAVGEDKIDISEIDADTSLAGLQTAIADTDGVFTVGEFRLRVAGNNTILELNSEGNAAAEFQVVLQAVSGLTAADVIL